MARTRKLFPIYGSALANNMLVALVHDRIVDRFVAAYVAEFDRRGILGGPARARELAETIGREILLAMIVEVRGALPQFFDKKQASILNADEKNVIEAFFREFWAALARAQNWNAEDRRQFRRDLALYSGYNPRRAAGPGGRIRARPDELETPFFARVALLLDPSMLEQARRAARGFHADVRQIARKLLRRTLGGA